MPNIRRDLGDYYRNVVVLRDRLLDAGVLRRVAIQDPRRHGELVEPGSACFAGRYPWGIYSNISGVESCFTLPKLFVRQGDNTTHDFLQCVVLDNVAERVFGLFDNRHGGGFRLITADRTTNEELDAIYAACLGQRVKYMLGTMGTGPVETTIMCCTGGDPVDEATTLTEHMERSLLLSSSTYRNLVAGVTGRFNTLFMRDRHTAWDVMRQAVVCPVTRGAVEEACLEDLVPGCLVRGEGQDYIHSLPLLSWNFNGVQESARKVVLVFRAESRGCRLLSNARVIPPIPKTPEDFAGLFLLLSGQVPAARIKGDLGETEGGFVVWKTGVPAA